MKGEKAVPNRSKKKLTERGRRGIHRGDPKAHLKALFAKKFFSPVEEETTSD